MKILWNLPRIFAVVCLLQVALFSARMNPQVATTPPTGPGHPPGSPQTSKMTPTGLQANGGSIAKDVYTNSIYGFSMKIPPGWAVVPAREPALPRFGTQDAELLKSAQISRPILVLTENAPLKKSYQRKNIQIIATRLHAPAGPTSAQDYLEYSQKTAKEKSMDVEYLGSPQEVTVHGQTLWKLASKEPTNGVMQHVEQYVITRESVLLQFFLVSPEEAGLKQLEPSIQSLEFKPMTPRTPQKAPGKKAKATPPSGSKPQ
jgi:hypothetical protein